MTALFAVYLRASAIGGILALLFIVLRKLLAKRAGLFWREAAFSLLALFLLAPVCFPISIAGDGAVPEAVQATAQWISVAENIAAQPILRAPLPETTLRLPSAMDILAWTWALGCAGLLAYKGIAACGLRRKVRATPLRDERALRLIRDLQVNHPLRLLPALRKARVGPAVRGILRPQILLTDDALQMDDDDLRFVLCHECAHIARLDTLRLLLLQAAEALHWWNPLIRIAVRAARKDIELFCDQSVLRRLGDGSRADYGRALVHMATLSTGALYPHAAEHPLKERLRFIMHRKKQGLWVSVFVTSVCCLLVFAMIIIPVRAEPQESPAANATMPAPTPVITPVITATPAATLSVTQTPAPSPTATATPASTTAPELVPQYGEAISWADIKPVISTGQSVAVVDFATLRSFSVTLTNRPNHADFEPTTAEDVAILKKCYGGEWSWNRRAVLVYIDGGWVAASINGWPHGEAEVDVENGLDGFFCMHFLGSKTHGTGIVDSGHQDMILLAAGQ